VGLAVRQAEHEVVAAGLDMENAEMAEFAYTPGGWKHEPPRVIVRGIRVAAEEVSGDGRSRGCYRRAIPSWSDGATRAGSDGLRLQLQLPARRQDRRPIAAQLAADAILAGSPSSGYSPAPVTLASR